LKKVKGKDTWLGVGLHIFDGTKIDIEEEKGVAFVEVNLAQR